jgi:alpha-1,3-glucan synthase
MKRFPVDLYHIHDFHGAVAPLHLLPRVIPCCLSLHNTDLQGQWSARTLEETKELCRIFNLRQGIVREYIQFGEVFNLLHAAVSYLRVWQSGFGAVGVSAKYSTRSFARYPIFWGLGKIGSLTYPDLADAEDHNLHISVTRPVTPTTRRDSKANRALLITKAQGWAQLEKNPDAEMFVFVGPWSKQKGIDLIADLFPAILEKHPMAQLVCIGPIIDLYGKFAALKLETVSRIYSGRVCSRPGSTVVPSCIYGAAEFVLIPSRDEPCSLIGLRFGRQGALGVGARVGDSGHMPGWWFTVESTSPKHMISQFKKAVEAALASNADVRAIMRAQSTRQQFLVSEWRTDLGILHNNAIRLSQRKNYIVTRGPASIKRGAADSVAVRRPQNSFCAKNRSFGPTDIPRIISPINPLNHVSDLTKPEEADKMNSSSVLRTEPGRFVGDVARQKNHLGQVHEIDKLRSSLPYVLPFSLTSLLFVISS